MNIEKAEASFARVNGRPAVVFFDAAGEPEAIVPLVGRKAGRLLGPDGASTARREPDPTAYMDERERRHYRANMARLEAQAEDKAKAAAERAFARRAAELEAREAGAIARAEAKAAAAADSAFARRIAELEESAAESGPGSAVPPPAKASSKKASSKKES